MKTKKNITKKSLIFLLIFSFIIVNINITVLAVTYPNIDLSEKSIKSVVAMRLSNDCAIAAMSTVEAYINNLMGVAKETAYDTIWKLNGKTVMANWTKCGYSSLKTSSQNDLLIKAYNSLKNGLPCIIRTIGGNSHFAIIVKYEGNSDILTKAGFIVMEINKAGNALLYTLNEWTTKWEGEISQVVTRGKGAGNITNTIVDTPEKYIIVDTLEAKNITETNAVLTGRINGVTNGDTVRSGFYLGKDEMNLTEVVSFPALNTASYNMSCDLKSEAKQTLEPGKPYWYRAYAIGKDGNTYLGDKKSFTTKSPTTPTTTTTPVVTTSPASGITQTNAVLNGSVSKQNSVKLTETGFYFGDNSNNMKKVGKFSVTTSQNNQNNGTGFPITCNLNKEAGITLEAGKTYYYKCYVIYDGKEETGIPRTFEATPKPDEKEKESLKITFNNLNTSGITQTNAILNGRVNFTVGYKISQTKIFLGTSSSTMSEIFSSDTSNYNINWNNGVMNSAWNLNTECGYTLAPGTKYYWQFGAVCDGQTYYSDIINFTTNQPDKPSNADIKYSNLGTSGITQTNAVLNGRVNFTVGYKISETQIYLGTSISNMSKIFSSNTSQYNINWNIGYMNSNWNLNAECGYTLAPGTTYYWRYGAVCDNVTYFSEVMGFTTLAEEKPTVITENADLISHNNAQLLGTVNKQINVKLSEKGFYLGTSTSNMRKVGSVAALDIDNNSIYARASCNLNTNGVTLTPETTYYYQFYIISNGVEYKGELKNFKTLLEPINKIITFTNLSSQNVTPTNASLSCSVVSTYEIFDYSDYLYVGTSASNLQSYSVGVGSLGGAKTKNLTYNVTSLSPGTTYYYQFCIRDMKTNMFYESEIKSFTTSPAPTEPPPPPPPTDVTITNLSTSGITRTNAVLNCRSYYTIGQKISNTKIFIGTSSSNMPEVLNSDNSKYNINWNIGYMNSSWNLNTECGVTLSPGTTYYWRFGMVCNGYTYYSDIMSFTTLS